MKRNGTKRRLPRHVLPILLICLLTPLMMGGCEMLRDRVVDEIENATRGVFAAALDLFFDQLRSNEAGRL